jgi:PAS domain S-box-containing protein
MPEQQILYLGKSDSEAEKFSSELAEHSGRYLVTSAATLGSPATQLDDVDCVVVVHDSPTADTSDILQILNHEAPELPVVVYAVQKSAEVAAQAVNTGVDQYINKTDINGGERLAAAVAKVTRTEASSEANPPREFSPADIINQSPRATFVLNRDHEVVYWNEACANLLHCDADEVLGATRPFKAFYDEPRPVLADLVLEDADDKQIAKWYDNWYESPHRKGTLVGEDYFPEQDLWLRFAATPLTDANGTVVGAIETLTDITRHEKRKRELERYKTIVETAGDPVYTLDEAREFTFVNDKVVEMTGYERDALLGEHVSKILYEDDIEKAQQHIEILLESDEQKGTIEVDIITADGERRTCEVHLSVLPFENEFQGTVGVVRDITNRKERERDLQMFREAVEQTGHAVVVTDTDGSIEYVNPAFEELTGYDRKDAIGNTPAMLKSGHHGQAFYEDLWNTILSGEVWEGEIVNEGKNDQRFVIHETISPIKNRDGEIQVFVGIQNDITAQRLREQQLKVFHRVLRHNLRNKGTAIKGNADVLERSLSCEADIERLQTIQRNVQSLIDISEKAHHVRQIVADALDQTAARSLSSVIERISKRIESSHPNSEITVVDETDNSREIDARALHAFYELVENAISHSNAKTPHAEVTVTADATTATVTISDNGPGIPDQEQRVLAAGTEDPLEHSSGLGLWFSHWLIHYVGGNITIDTNESGTTVIVTVPLQ